MFKRFVLSIKRRSKATLRAWSYQCESIVAQRSRRIQQLFTFYNSVYGPYRLQQILSAYRRQIPTPGFSVMMSAVGLFSVSSNDLVDNSENSKSNTTSNNINSNIESVVMENTSNPNSTVVDFDWAKERLSLANFEACQSDIEFIETLNRNQLCSLCKEKQMKYCYCSLGNKRCRGKSGHETIKNCRKSMEFQHERQTLVDGPVLIKGSDEANWEPYFSKDDFSIWRREERPSMYAYKVYARFDDVTANDLLHVQTDIVYRRQWDDSALALDLIDTDPTAGSNSHLIYWEMQWPRLFANRDYVYCRRYLTDENHKVMLVCSRGTQHPAYPINANKVRVTDYWSLMVIKPQRSFQEPGVHYVLTYFDDPGLPIPQSIKSWVTQKQMPEFLKKMYLATKQYACKRALEMQKMHHFDNFNIMDNEYTANATRGSWLGRYMWKQRERGK